MTVTARAARTLALTMLCLCLVPAAIRAAEGSDDIAAAVDRAFRPLLQEHEVAGMAVAVTEGGRQHFFSYGVSSREAMKPVTKDTIFEIGSLSKTITALAGYAQALGKLSLDDRPGQYMPELRSSAVDGARLLHLGTYTAGGLPLQFPDSVASNAEMPGFFRDWKASASPGTQRRYSNPSLGLFGHVTALAMGRDFTDLVETELFPKLGLTGSYIRVPRARMDDYAWGTSKAGKPIRVSPGVLDAPAYGVKSSAAELIRFVEANIRPESLDPQIGRAIQATHVGYFRVGEMVQGLGWEQYPWPIPLERLLAGNSTTMIMEPNAATELTPPAAPSQPTLFNKTGSTNGFGAYIAFVPVQRIGIVMLANKSLPIPARIKAAHAVLEQLALNAP